MVSSDPQASYGSERLSTPVLFVVFNRPDTTFRVFEEIRKARPKELFISADGPRASRPDDVVKCESVRSIVDRVDWECNVHTLFREKNLGCKMAVSSGITWFFENVEEGIIIEDDCLPDQGFFSFCTQLLERYRSDDEIMHIGGDNFISHLYSTGSSYYFSRHNHIWGWATWRRAWQKYDVHMKHFPEFYRQNEIDRTFGSDLAKYYWLYKFYGVYSGKIDTWDYQWVYTILQQKGKAIVPAANLVSNIGFGDSATHDLKNVSDFDNLPRNTFKELVHPASTVLDVEADKLTDRVVFKITLWRKLVLFFMVPLVMARLKA